MLARRVLYPVGRLFTQLVSRMFLQQRITPDLLHRFASNRCNIAENAQTSGQDAYARCQSLVTNTLKFSEECLRDWVPGSHFELCVFVDQEQPLLFAYFDSNQDTNARSMKDRETNPHFILRRVMK
jgi:hypothetical protein